MRAVGIFLISALLSCCTKKNSDSDSQAPNNPETSFPKVSCSLNPGSPDRPVSKTEPRFGVVLGTYNRPLLLRITLESLLHSDMPANTIVVLADDQSTDSETINLIENWVMSPYEVVRVKNEKNSGVVDSFLNGINVIKDKVDFVATLDPDVYVKKGWLQDLYATYQKANTDQTILTSFHMPGYFQGCNSNQPLCKLGGVAGVQHFYSTQFYKSYVQKWLQSINAERSWHLWDQHINTCMKSLQFSFYTNPSTSFVQHLGFTGVHYSPSDKLGEESAFAQDF